MKARKRLARLRRRQKSYDDMVKRPDFKGERGHRRPGSLKK